MGASAGKQTEGLVKLAGEASSNIFVAHTRYVNTMRTCDMLPCCVHEICYHVAYMRYVTKLHKWNTLPYYIHAIYYHVGYMQDATMLCIGDMLPCFAGNQGTKQSLSWLPDIKE